MDIQDLRLFVINLAALALSLTEIEMMLKITLLISSIGYTVTKWIELYKNKNDNSETK